MIYGTAKHEESGITILNIRWPQRALWRVTGPDNLEFLVWDDDEGDAISSVCEFAGLDEHEADEELRVYRVDTETWKQVVRDTNKALAREAARYGDK